MIYLCIPAHNEASTVGVLLWKIRNVLRDFGRDYQVLALDDASDDGTSATLERYEATLPLTILRSQRRLGYAGAVERLLREVVQRSSYPKRDAAVVLQADFTEDPADVVALIKMLEGGADIVTGVETEGAVRQPRGMRLARWGSRILMTGAYHAAPVTDPTCGFRAYRVIVLKKAFREAPIMGSNRDRWSANVELLAMLAPHARRIEETPLTLRHHLLRRESRFRPMKVVKGVRKTIRGAAWPVPVQGAAS